MARKTKKAIKPKGRTARPTRQAPIPATEPTPAVGGSPSEQTSPPEAETTRPGEGAGAEKSRKPLKTQEVTAEKEKYTPLPAALIERAKKIGFSDEQIAAYTDPEALEMACNRIKPQVTAPPPKKKKRQIFRPFKDKPKGKPAQATCISEINTIRAAHVIRAGYDESNMGVFCRQHKPKILPESIQKVTVVRDYVPNKRDILTSTITIDYLEG